MARLKPGAGITQMQPKREDSRHSNEFGESHLQLLIRNTKDCLRPLQDGWSACSSQHKVKRQVMLD